MSGMIKAQDLLASSRKRWEKKIFPQPQRNLKAVHAHDDEDALLQTTKRDDVSFYCRYTLYNFFLSSLFAPLDVVVGLADALPPVLALAPPGGRPLAPLAVHGADGVRGAGGVAGGQGGGDADALPHGDVTLT